MRQTETVEVTGSSSNIYGDEGIMTKIGEVMSEMEAEGWRLCELEADALRGEDEGTSGTISATMVFE